MKHFQSPPGLKSLLVAPPTFATATTTKKKLQRGTEISTTTQVRPLYLLPQQHLSPEPRPALIHEGWSRPTCAAVAHFQQIPAGLDEAGEKTFLHHYTWAKRNYR